MITSHLDCQALLLSLCNTTGLVRRLHNPRMTSKPIGVATTSSCAAHEEIHDPTLTQAT